MQDCDVIFVGELNRRTKQNHKIVDLRLFDALENLPKMHSPCILVHVAMLDCVFIHSLGDFSGELWAKIGHSTRI